MRIIHTSDWHLGRRFEREPLEDDQRAFLAWLAELVAERQVDLVIVAGDVYDRSQPAEDAVALLDARPRRPAGRRCRGRAHPRQPRQRPPARLRGRPPGARRGARVRRRAAPARPAGRPGARAASGSPSSPSPSSTPTSPRHPGRPATAPPGPATHESVLADALEAGSARPRRPRRRCRRSPWPTPTCPGRDSRTPSAPWPSAAPTRSTPPCSPGSTTSPSATSTVPSASAGPMPSPTRGRRSPTPSARTTRSPSASSRSTPTARSPTSPPWPVPVGRRVVTLTGTLEELLADPAHERFVDHWVAARLTDDTVQTQPMERLRARFPHAVSLRYDDPRTGADRWTSGRTAHPSRSAPTRSVVARVPGGGAGPGRRRTPSARLVLAAAGRRAPRGTGDEAARPPAPGLRLLRRCVRHRLRPAGPARGLLDHRSDRAPASRPSSTPSSTPSTTTSRDSGSTATSAASTPTPGPAPRSPSSSRPRAATGSSTRSPAQTRPSAGGGAGLVEDPSRVVLAEAGGRRRRRSPGSATVAERLAELVGLDKAQFEQVVLIPQGRFEEVLKARTQERADLLAKLFPVDVYIRTTDALRQLAADRRDAYEELAGGRRTAEDRIRADVAAFVAEADPTVRRATGSTTGPARWPPVPDTLDATTQAPRPRWTWRTCPSSVTGWRPCSPRWSPSGTRRPPATRRRVPHGPTSRRRSSGGSSGRRTWPRRAPTPQRRRPTPSSPSRSAGPPPSPRCPRPSRRGARPPSGWRALDAERRRLRAAVDADWVDGADRSALDTADRRPPPVRHRRRRGRRPGGRRTADSSSWARRHDDLERRRADPGRAAPPPWPRPSPPGTASPSGWPPPRLPRWRGCPGGRTRPAAVARVARLERRRGRASGTAPAVARQVGGPRRRPGRGRASLAGAEERVAALRTAWRAGLAGRLAAHLEDGAPCPTCGATEHPSPAEPAADAPTDDELDAAEDGAGACSEAQPRHRRPAGRGAGEARRPPPVPRRRRTSRTAWPRPGPSWTAIDAAIAERCRTGRGARRAARRCDGRRRAHRRRALGALDGLSGRAGRAACPSGRPTVTPSWPSSAPWRRRGRPRRPVGGWRRRSAALAGNLEATAAARAAADRAPRRHGADTRGVRRRRPRRPGALVAVRGRRPVHAGRAGRAGRAPARRSPPGSTPTWPAADPSGRRRWRRRCRPSGRRRRPTTDLVGRVASHDRPARPPWTRRSPSWPTAPPPWPTPWPAKEEADTLAGLCAGLGNGPDATRLSLKNWVLAYYLRQVLAHANRRLDTMTNGRYALDLERGARRRAPAVGPRHLGARRRDRPVPAGHHPVGWRDVHGRPVPGPRTGRRGVGRVQLLDRRALRGRGVRLARRRLARHRRSTCCGRSRTAAGWSG